MKPIGRHILPLMLAVPFFIAGGQASAARQPSSKPSTVLFVSTGASWGNTQVQQAQRTGLSLGVGAERRVGPEWLTLRLDVGRQAPGAANVWNTSLGALVSAERVRLKPYLSASAGVYWGDPPRDDGFNGAVGVGVRSGVGGRQIFVESRLHNFTAQVYRAGDPHRRFMWNILSIGMRL
ncbi:hypothetical protein [Gemmatimonas sp.]|jgi:hypothetical protein|uniref:hypothetical protein n=1 Tax=Gemmatimonas sp. TaxID=1962908 RepID=UPI0037C0401E